MRLILGCRSAPPCRQTQVVRAETVERASRWQWVCSSVGLSLTRIHADCFRPRRPSAARAPHTLKRFVAFGLLLAGTVGALAQGAPGAALSRLLAFEGKVEVARAGTAAWAIGGPNQLLQNGDRLRTGVRSRATIEL